MQETQGSHCKCHFLCPLKERIIRGYPDKAHNYGYGSVRIRIATVTGIIRILPIRVSPYVEPTIRTLPEPEWSKIVALSPYTGKRRLSLIYGEVGVKLN